jgi:hypothetical protein
MVVHFFEFENGLMALHDSPHAGCLVFQGDKVIQMTYTGAVLTQHGGENCGNTATSELPSFFIWEIGDASQVNKNELMNEQSIDH